MALIHPLDGIVTSYCQHVRENSCNSKPLEESTISTGVIYPASSSSSLEFEGGAILWLTSVIAVSAGQSMPRCVLWPITLEDTRCRCGWPLHLGQ
ncbi:hypothetical protein FIBSPDRAFT_869809 [Athelia psychrophila]|uniref:Uncharacterized protein n=1 Tax=Athelia psychrophila TaxID=1759441 RepID=A0A166BNR8_9AGAM|nr:hypothetical protein FIBSPDRAFT_869809 [Fibularhizoctonia sp. CBS 109695]